MTCKCKLSFDKSICCNNKADSSGYCLYHKPNKTKEESKLFIERIIKENISDFRGFIFEEDFNINEVINYDYKKLNFDGAIFKKRANFSNYEFICDVSFNYVNFNDYTTFINSIFLGNCNFYKTSFNKKYLNEKIFEKVKFKGQNLVINNVSNLPRMDGILFCSATKFMFRDTEYKKGEYLYGKINYRIARNQAHKIGDLERIGYYYYKERAYGSKIMKSSDYPTHSEYLYARFFDRLSKYAIGYGERPWNILIVTVLIISIFAFLYMFVGISTIDNKIIGLDFRNIRNYPFEELINMYVDLWYFSMITFSTVGYGDMIVTTILGKILVTIEVFLGVTIGATWASVVIKRMIR